MDLNWNKLEVRPYEERDDEFISSLIQKNFNKSYFYHKKSYRQCLVVENDGIPIGFVDWEYAQSSLISKKYNNIKTKQFFLQFRDAFILYIHSIAIIEEMKGKGIGTMLIDILISSHTPKNCAIVALAVQDSSGHINSEKLFKSFHFKQYDPIDDAWDQSESPVNNCPTCKDSDMCKCSAVPFIKF